MLKINHKYPYRPLERVDSPEGRRYLVNGQALPSVTTILSATRDNTHLDEWIRAVGKTEADRICTQSSNIGSGMHSNLENYVLGNPMSGSVMEKSLAQLIVRKGLTHVDEVWGSEVAVYSEGLYAGTADLIGMHMGIPSIIDFKNSRNHKPKAHIEGYFMQCAAYALAHNEMFGTDIQRGVIMIANQDGRYQEFIIESDEFQHYALKWASAVEEFFGKYQAR